MAIYYFEILQYIQKIYKRLGHITNLVSNLNQTIKNTKKLQTLVCERFFSRLDNLVASSCWDFVRFDSFYYNE